MGTTATADRRDPTAPRRPFRATVDLAPDDDHDGWQADAMDLSISGMSVRTAMLPGVGEQLAFHFSLADGRPVEGRGEVVWARDRGERAGAFGVKFATLPSEVEAAIRENVGTPPTVATPAPGVDETKVKLYIQGMDAPLRARVRQRKTDAMILGSDLSFLRLGEKVEVDGAHARAAGTIEAVDVEVDAVTGIPRLVLTVDLLGRPRKVPVAAAPAPTATVEVPSPAVTPVVAPTAEAVDGAQATPKTTTSRKGVVHNAAQATKVLADVHQDADSNAPEASTAAHTDEDTDPDGYDDELDDMSSTPSWLKNALVSAKTLGGRAVTAAGPAFRGATVAVGAFSQRLTGIVREKIQGRAGISRTTTSAPRNGLRPQHAMDSDTGADGAPMGGLRTRRVVVYAAAGLTLAAGIVAVASTGGPRTTPPHPQVAVAPASPDALAATATPTTAATDTTEATDPADPTPTGASARTVTARGALPPDLAAAQNSPSARADEQPILGFARARAARVAANRPVGAPRADVAITPVARGAVFGNPAIRTGTTLHLRMDGPIERLSGAGARGGAIVLDIPGRHSLDVASPLVRLDPRLSSAQVYNRPSGAELTLRFREAAPPFVARAMGNSVEIVLGATPGAARSQPATSRHGRLTLRRR